MVKLSEISEKLQNGKANDVSALVTQAINDKIPPAQILNEGLVAGMDMIGKKFKNNEIYVPEVLIAARAMNAGLKVLEPKLVESGVQPRGTVVLGTIKGDLHDIGKNLVGMMLKGAGFKVVDLGIDVTPEKFVEEAQKSNANVLAMSALLTTTMVGMKDVVLKLKEKDKSGKIKTIIGGAPITQNYCDSIGADGYAPDAASAVDKVKELMN